MIKRSSREKELKKGFKVCEMLSISTLEWAWESKSLWPSYWLGHSSLSAVKLLERINSSCSSGRERKCEWSAGTINTTAHNGNLEMIKYCVANECPINEWACTEAARNGHLECLKYLREEARLGKTPFQNGHLHILEYLVERKYDQFDEKACEYAATLDTV